MALTRLTVELVPRRCWGSNLRSSLTREQWKTCQQFVYARSGRLCEVCGDRGDRWPVECHETWFYDDENSVQKLMGLVALCPMCHRSKHAGFAASNGRLGEVIIHLSKLNDWPLEHTELYLEAVFEVWDRRSRQGWHLDTTWLACLGLPGGYTDMEERA